ncbi:NVEALA domain-containing protein [uncultured Parabacteroides sp.]|uniref:NVEALA domain-containing protein n=1 Tax=uncultured Parabacteroides sp. TaxID=512312 RepID=UPI003419E0BE
MICIAVIAIVASISAWNYNQSQKGANLSDLAMANIEALARAEIGDAAYYVKIHDLHSWTCYAGGSSYCPL